MKRSALVLVISLLAGTCLFGQDTTYYYGVNGRIVHSQEDAVLRKQLWSGSRRYKIKFYSRRGEEWILYRTEKAGIKKDGHHNIRYWQGTFFPKTYRRYTEQTGPGLYYFRDEKSTVVRRSGNASSLVPLHLEGKLTENYKAGELKSVSFYNNNVLLSNNNWRPDGSEYISNLFYSVDRQPQFGPGQNYLQKYLLGQIVEKEIPVTEIQDEILIGAVILASGELTGVVILKGRVQSLNEFFVETFSRLPGNWKPAVLDGKAVNYFITFPMNFINDIPSLQSVELTPGGQLFWSD